MIRVASGAVAITLLLLTLFLFPMNVPGGDLGICLPSPNEWDIPRIPSRIANALLILLAVVLFWLANKKFNFIPEPKPLTSVTLLLQLASNPLSTSFLSTSTLLLLCNVVVFSIIISTYEAPFSTREFFLAGTFPAIGAMVQYSFIVMVPVYIGAGLLMKSMRFREFIAFLLGLLAPYWIAVGLGWVSPFAFRFPDSLMIVNRGAIAGDIFLMLLEVGILALVGFILSLYNGVRLLSRNSRFRSIHTSFNLMGYVSVLAIVFDFNNFVAYFGTLALWVAIQIGAVVHFYHIRHPQVALLLILALVLPLYFLSL